MREDYMSNAEAIGILARMISTRQDLTLDEITALRTRRGRKATAWHLRSFWRL